MRTPPRPNRVYRQPAKPWHAAADFTRRCFGAAQIEMVFAADGSPAHRDAVASRFLGVNQSLLAALTAAETVGEPAQPPAARGGSSISGIFNVVTTLVYGRSAS